MTQSIEWIKPNGKRIEANDTEETTDYARSLGWKIFSETPEGLAEAKAVLKEKEDRALATVKAAEEKAPKAPKNAAA